MHSFVQLLEQLEAFGAQNPFPGTPAELYEPCNYMLGLGGKRLRPALLLMGYELFTDAPLQPALPAAWAVELFHNFSLIHDDIMDAAPLRRGQATVHTRWNTTTGILSGDVMLIYAYQFLSQAATPAVTPALLRTFNRVATEVCEGQQYDMNFETRDDVNLEEYVRMIELKTAVLIGGALEMGAYCAGAAESDARHLYNFGRYAGIAFQLQDDLLDTYGDPQKFGKQVGGDILQNKKTFLVLKTLETASSTDRSALLHWMDAQYAAVPDEKVEAVRHLFNRNGAPHALSVEKDRFRELAADALAKVDAPADKKAVLWDLADRLIDRDS